MAGNRREFLLGAATVAAGVPLSSFAHAAERTGVAGSSTHAETASPFLLEFDGAVLTSLKFAGDSLPTNYVARGQKLGHIEIAWRRGSGSWQRFKTADATASSAEGQYQASDDSGQALAVTLNLKPHGNVLRWTIGLRNISSEPIEIGDLAVPLPMHATFVPKGSTSDLPVLKHSFISGHGSFLFWMRSNSVGPYLVMMPERSTSLEYWDHPRPHRGQRRVFPAYRVYIHSAAVGEEVAAHDGRWRQPRTSLTLTPGKSREYGFELAGAQDYAGVRQRVVDAGLIDVEVAPGMTVPTDLSTCIAIRSHEPVKSIVAEHPEQTTITALGVRSGRRLYRVNFQRLGENLLTVNHGGGRSTRLEFFATEPLETLAHKRAAFTTKHQVRDKSKWYNGLLCEWNMESHVQLSPDNYDQIKGWRIYEVTCDDPGLSKPAYLASKNAEFPNQEEIEALDYYIEHFVWGGLQRTTDETHSYG
ncbi:MAG: DUF5695 domain-containing protein, partial [Acidobacteriaceae bacterium]